MIDNRKEFCWRLLREADVQRVFCVQTGIFRLGEIIDNVTDRRPVASKSDRI